MDGKKTLLLAGASGRLGHMVLHHWTTSPSERIEVLPQYRSTVAAGTGLSWSPMTGTQALREHVQRTGPIDAMVMLAGICPGPGQDVALNAPLAEACLSGAAEAGIPRVLLASSTAVYGPGDETPFQEAMPCRPANAYGRAKLEMEGRCDAWRGRGVEICCLRIGNVAGADALLTAIARAEPGSPVTIDAFRDGGGPVRSYIGAGTLADVLETLAMQDGALPPVLNIAAPDPVSMEALARAGGYRYRMKPAPASAHRRITLDCTLLERFHGFRTDDSDPHVMLAQWKETLAR